MANGAAVHGVDLSEVNQRNGHERASEVAEPHDHPVLQHAGPVDFARCLRATHKRIAREQLSAAAQHKHEAKAEANTADHALRRERNCGVPQEHAEIHAAERDERAREHRRYEAFARSHSRFRYADAFGFGLGFCR